MIERAVKVLACLGLVVLAVSCGGTGSPSPTIPSLPTAPSGFRSYGVGDGYRVALPDAWQVEPNPEEGTRLRAQAPNGGTELALYWDEGALTGDTLSSYFDNTKLIYEGLWDAPVVRTDSSVGGMPALRGEAQQGDPATHHVFYVVESPAGSTNAWAITLDTPGEAADPALDAIISSMAFVTE